MAIQEPTLVQALLEALDRPSVVVRRDGSLVIANVQAEELLSAQRERVLTLLGAMRELGSPLNMATWSSGTLTAHYRSVTGCPYAIVTITESTSVAARPDPVSRVAREWALTPRQTGILRLLLEGNANKDIANELAISNRTVEIHVTAILAKARVDSRARLIAAVLNRSSVERLSA